MHVRTFKDSPDPTSSVAGAGSKNNRNADPAAHNLQSEVMLSPNGRGVPLDKRRTPSTAFVYDAFSERSFSRSIIRTSSGRDRACIFSIARLL